MGAFGYPDIAKHNFKYMHNLLDDVANGKKIKLVDGSSSKFNDSNDIRILRKYVASQSASEVKNLLERKGDEIFIDSETTAGYRFTQIDKLPYSKGGGSGAGSAVTKLSESAVCIALASLVHMGHFNLDEKTTVDRISGVLDLGTSNTSGEIKKVLNWLKENEDWLDSTLKTAKTIKNKLSLTSQHHFHRDSVFMNSIYKQFRKNLKPLNKIGLRVSGDKWNPSDIWISTRNKMPAHNDLVSLNKTILEGFKSSNIIGISLKKIGKSVTWKVYNLPNEKKLFKFKNIKNQSSPFNAKDAYVVTESGMYLQIRTFGPNENVQCELKGQYANGGKCGFGSTKHIIESLTKTRILGKEVIKKMDDHQILSQIKKYYDKCFTGVSLSTLKKELEKKKFNSDLAKMDFLISKLQALQIASAIKGDKERNDIVTAIYGYAHSMGLAEMFEASVYAKVS